MSKITVAAVQATPVFLDRDATIDKACRLIAEAGRKAAALAVFPEAFVPAYPDWVWAIPPSEFGLLGSLHAELLANSVAIPSPATDKLCDAARKAKVCVVIGVNERNVEASGASLYNTLLYIGPDGRILGKHRKLVPTGGERLVWAPGDGSTLRRLRPALGKLGGLICWENYMPLARYAMYAWGTQIYVAATWDRGERWLSTLRAHRQGRWRLRHRLLHAPCASTTFPTATTSRSASTRATTSGSTSATAPSSAPTAASSRGRLA